MKDQPLEYGLWYSESSNSHTFCVLKEIKKTILEKDAELIWTVKARSWNEACQKRNNYLGWGKYKPLEDDVDDHRLPGHRHIKHKKMTTQKQIKDYIASQPDTKRSDIEALHKLIRKAFPKGKLWFLDGKDDKGKIVTNPNIGYGLLIIKYADGKTKEFYQVGISANTTGISVYIMGIQDKKYLPKSYGKKIGKATVTGYCIKFKALKDIDIDILETAIRDGIKQTS